MGQGCVMTNIFFIIFDLEISCKNVYFSVYTFQSNE